jgi:rod shape determining protein RodA
MGTLRLQPARLAAFTPRAIVNVWSVFDIQLAVYALALVVIGLLMAFTNSGDAALAGGSLFTKALMWLAIALMIFTVSAAVDYRWSRTFSWLLYLINLGLLVLTIAIGTGIGGVSRWVTILGLQFQFSEVAKVLMAIVLATWIANHHGRVGSLWTIVGAVLLAGPPLVLILIQPDLGTSLVIGAILLGSLFISGASLRWLGAGILMLLALVPILWTEVLKQYQKDRLVAFLNPTTDPKGAGYQLLQSQIAVSSGGAFGRGLTNGSTGQDYLPVNSTDMVFSRVGEELGFVGGAVVLILFTLLIWRVLVIGWRCRDPFGLAFAGGMAGLLLFQMLVNVGMVLGVMPITGIPLPFISSGGASLISLALGLGIMESIAMRQGRPGG